MLGLIADRLALFGDPQNRDMPPLGERDAQINPTYFDLSASDLEKIRKWMESGAIVAGKPYLDSESLEKIKGKRK